MSFEKINKKLGFGCMRLKMDGDKVDYNEFNKMIDMFMEAGFNYFDTAHGYIGGLSETSIRDCLSARYPRESFVLANKLSDPYFEKEEDILPLLESRLCWRISCLTRILKRKRIFYPFLKVSLRSAAWITLISIFSTVLTAIFIKSIKAATLSG